MFCRQQRELADVEISRLTAQLEAAKVAAAAAAAQNGDFIKAASEKQEAGVAQQVQVCTMTLLLHFFCCD